jgi:hypothetical protein
MSLTLLIGLHIRPRAGGATTWSYRRNHHPIRLSPGPVPGPGESLNFFGLDRGSLKSWLH